MRLRRITLRNYRGVEDRTVEFAPAGVTVVAGPNEIGKTSLAEALDLLLDEYDSSKKKGVLAVKPVHRDEGAEIEAEIEAGAYRFTYFKRFHKRPETRLTVTTPQAESVNGREAHDRVRAILEQTVDMALWSALRIDQGTALSLPSIGDSPSLSKALDAAAGAARADDDALTLFDRSREEFERWFTATGREKKELSDLSAVVADREKECERISESLRQLERDAERSSALAIEIEERTGQLEKDEKQATSADEALRALERQQGEVERVEVECKTARTLADAAERDQTARTKLAAACAKRRTALGEARDAVVAGRPSSTNASDALADAVAELDAARSADAAAEKASTLREDDLEFRRAELDRAQLSERLARIVSAEEAASAAEEVLAESRVDAKALDALRGAQQAADEARIRAEAGSPEVEVAAKRDVSVRDGGDETIVSAGESVTRAALDEVVVDALGVVRVTIRPAGDSSDLRAAVGATADRLSTLLSRCGVADLGAAETSRAARQEAERAVARREDIVRDNLRDLTRADIERKVRNLGPRVDAYRVERNAVLGAAEVPATFDAAQEALTEARGFRREASTNLESHRRTHEAARQEVERLRLAAETDRARVEHAEGDVQRAEAELERARADSGDDAIAARSVESARRAADAEQSAAAARAALDATRPDDVRRAAEGAAAAVKSTRDALRTAQDEAIEIRAKLKQAGQDGLAERLDSVKTTLHHAFLERDRTNSRAAAARLLFQTLAEKRDSARRSYVAPLRERVNRLGRFIFGTSFEIELDEELTITNRTLEGRTVPFDDLSGGAREQLDLVMRAAAAMVVSASGGVPLVLDDALGYSDPERLAALGAVLSLAGEHCQVIVLTCIPDRYRHVPNAQVVRLGQGRGRADSRGLER